MKRASALLSLLATALVVPALAQTWPAPPESHVLSAEELAQLKEKKDQLLARVKSLAEQRNVHTADAAVFLHTAEIAEKLSLYTKKDHASQLAAVLRGLDLGLERADLLFRNNRPWAQAPGRSLRGYLSRVDGSVQPYGVILPAKYDPQSKTPLRLDVVLHGRGTSEIRFLQENERPPSRTPATPAPVDPFAPNFIELHCFGRGNNGWRWSGETDVFEAIEAVKREYPIDPNKIVLRGFSMGGHGAWHIGTHYPHLWSGVNPGAGFSETRKYTKVTQEPPDHQVKAWHIYDAVDYALNLFNTPFYGYGGELDPQLAAAMNMKEAAAKEGIELKVFVGPKMEHREHPEMKREIMRLLARAERDPRPELVKFTTWTMKYPECHWVKIEGLEEHYRRANVIADATSQTLKVKTDNVTAVTFDPLPRATTQVEIDGQTLRVAPAVPIQLKREKGKWALGRLGGGLRKRRNLQGPIDDAFMDTFFVVRGTGTPWHPAAQLHAEKALRQFESDWRFGFRGELRPVPDTEVTPAFAQRGHLVLFGDPGSNKVLAKIAGKLPIRWTRAGIQVGKQTYSPEHVPVLIFPNPQNPQKYVVINTGHTFTRKDLDGTNALLTPKLGDWAILKPGEGQPQVVTAGFFNEEWKLKE